MKKIFQYLMLLGAASFTFTSCSNDDDDTVVVDDDTTNDDADTDADGDTDEEDDIVVADLNGVYVLCEGAYYYSIDGSLSFIDFETNTISNGLFAAVNGRSLGGTPNSLARDEQSGVLFIAVTDENRVEIVDAELNSLGYVSITQPREVVYSDGYAYVSAYDGTVSKISEESLSIVATSATVGACLEGIAVRGDYVYVCNAYNADYTYNTNVVKLSASDLSTVGEVTVADNPTALKVSGDDLYLLSTGDYYLVQSQLQLIDSDDNVSYICDATQFDVYDGQLYVINSVTDWTTYVTTTDYQIISAAGNVTNYTPAYDIASVIELSVNPSNGEIFVSSYNLSEWGYADYSGEGYIVQFGTTFDTYSNVYTAGVAPSSFAW